MHARYVQTLVEPSEQVQPVTAVAWAPDGQRVAASLLDRTIQLFSSNASRLDKFKTKAASDTNSNYLITALAWGPSSELLAVGQSDSVTFIYRLDRSGKKSICNKILFSAAVSQVCWPPNSPQAVLCGCVDGKVRAGSLESNKGTTLHQAQSVVALATCPVGAVLFTGHLDGWIYRVSAGAAGLGKGAQAEELVQHPTVPSALAASSQHLLAASHDAQVVIYSHQGQLLQQLAGSGQQPHRFCAAVHVPGTPSFVLGSYDHLHIVAQGPQGQLDFARHLHVPNMHTVTALACSPDAGQLVAGTLMGALDLYHMSFSSQLYRKRYLLQYGVDGSAAVKDTQADRQATLQPSKPGACVQHLDVYRDRFVVGFTADSLLLLDWASNKTSELPWQRTGCERFSFDYGEVCLAHNGTHVSMLQTGKPAALLAWPSDALDPAAISLRLQPQSSAGQLEGCVAYVEPQPASGGAKRSITTRHLSGSPPQSVTVCHAAITFLELSPSSAAVMALDEERRLYSIDTAAASSLQLAQGVSYAQWAPSQDILVAQAQGQCLMWLDPHVPESVRLGDCQGRLVGLAESQGGLELILSVDGTAAQYLVPQELVSLAEAVKISDLQRSVQCLASLPPALTVQLQQLQARLCSLALDQHDLDVGLQCALASGDAARASRIRKVTVQITQLPGGADNAIAQASMLALGGKAEQAEALLLDKAQPEDAVAMYLAAGEHLAAIRVAKQAGLAQHAAEAREAYLHWLEASGQHARLAQLAQGEGRLDEALDLYLAADRPVGACQMVLQHPGQHFTGSQLRALQQGLEAAQEHELLGDLLQAMALIEEAVAAFVRGAAFEKAALLAREAAPESLARVEEAWGDHDLQAGCAGDAVLHFQTAKAVSRAAAAAVQAGDVGLAGSLLDQMEPGAAAVQAAKLAELCHSDGRLEAAEALYERSGHGRKALQMWLGGGQWCQAHAAAVRQKLTQQQMQELYAAEGGTLVQQGSLPQAEALYLAFEDPDAALHMWHAHARYDEAVALVARVRPDQLAALHEQLGKQLVAELQPARAEPHLVAAGQWQSAASAYMKADQWQHAQRVARDHGGPNAEDEVAYVWAETLGPQEGCALLDSQGLTERVVVYAAQTDSFPFALKLAEASKRGDLVMAAHQHHGRALEQQGMLADAEKALVAGGVPADAFDMHMRAGRFQDALRLCERYHLSGMQQALTARAQEQAGQGELQAAEELWLRADCPAAALLMYRTVQRWKHAARIARQFFPDQVASVELEAAAGAPHALSTAGRALLQEGLGAAQRQDWPAAVAGLLGVTNQDSTRLDLLQQIWATAVEAASNQEATAHAAAAEEVAARLHEVGRHEAAADMLLAVGDVEGAVLVCAEAALFDRAAQCAGENFGLQQEVQQRRLAHLIATGAAQELASAGYTEEALEIWVQQGKWDHAFQAASHLGPDIVSDLCLRHAQAKLARGHTARAAAALASHPLLLEPSGHSLLHQVAIQVLAMGRLAKHAAQAETDCLAFLASAGAAARASDSKLQALWAAVLLTVLHRSCLDAGLADLAAQQAISRLRHLDLLPTDKAFYDAGVAARQAGDPGTALLLLNRYLDICEAQEDSAHGSQGGYNDFGMFTGIPRSAALPTAHYVAKAEQEQISDWALSTSMDHSIEASLPQAACPTCAKAMYAAALTCPTCRSTFPPCMASGRIGLSFIMHQHPVLHVSGLQASLGGTAGYPAVTADLEEHSIMGVPVMVKPAVWHQIRSLPHSAQLRLE